MEFEAGAFYQLNISIYHMTICIKGFQKQNNFHIKKNNIAKQGKDTGGYTFNKKAVPLG